MAKYTIEQWIEKSQRTHGDNYDYSLWTSDLKIRSSSRVPIICKKHNFTFYQILDNHVCGKGCPKCGRESRSESNKKGKLAFIETSKQNHTTKYDYSKLPEELTYYTKVEIGCPIHGIFIQQIGSHSEGRGCPKCASQQRKTTIAEKYGVSHPIHIKMDKDAISILNNKQQLENLYSTFTTETIALMLGVNAQTIANHLHDHGIAITNSPTSSGECDIRKFLEQYCSVESNTRKIISPKELDIYVPEHNIAIEYCGLYWHSEQAGKDKHYHKTKYESCQDKNIQLLTIFEDEWRDKKDLIQSKMLTLIGQDPRKIVYARHCDIVSKVPTKTKRQFFETNHIQGDGPSSINIGLVHNDELVAVVGFIKHKNHHYLNRYATSARVIGGFSKLLKYFQTNYEWNMLISFADLRWSNGTLYQRTGWELDSILPPDYYYSYPGGKDRFHKFNFRRSMLHTKLKTFDPHLSETENCDNNGMLRIWDCGKQRWIIKNE